MIHKNEVKKKPRSKATGLKKMAMTYSPGYPVPSALLSLTSLFGMGRGEPQCNNHHKSLFRRAENIIMTSKRKKIQYKNRSYNY